MKRFLMGVMLCSWAGSAAAGRLGVFGCQASAMVSAASPTVVRAANLASRAAPVVSQASRNGSQASQSASRAAATCINHCVGQLNGFLSQFAVTMVDRGYASQTIWFLETVLRGADMAQGLNELAAELEDLGATAEQRRGIRTNLQGLVAQRQANEANIRAFIAALRALQDERNATEQGTRAEAEADTDVDADADAEEGE